MTLEMRLNPALSALFAAGILLSASPSVGSAQTAPLSLSTGVDAPPGALPAQTGTTSAETPAQKQPTLITSTNGMTFEEKTRVVVYKGGVVVSDPQFNLTCDKLTAYLKKNASEGAGDNPKTGKAAHAKVSPSPTVAASDNGKKTSKSGEGASGLDHAVAEGNVVIIQDKKAENGDTTRSTGHGTKAVYEAASGDIALTGWPTMQQGENMQVATSAATVMILNRDGHLTTRGPSRTMIKSQADLNKAGGSSNPSASPKPRTAP